MKTTIALFLGLLFSSALQAQEPSAKDLRTLLHADVKSYANDGHLVATWSLRQADQLNAFEIPEAEAVKLVAAEGLCFAGADGKEAACAFKELEFEPPCKITFELRVDGADSGFIASIGDPVNPDDRVHVGVNVKIYGNSESRYDFIGRIKGASPEGKPSKSSAAITARSWTPVTIDWKRDRLSLSVGKNERAVLSDPPYKRFDISIGVPEGKAAIRNLTIDSQVNRDSMRKLFRSVTAEATAAPAADSRGSDEGSAWEKVGEEMHRGELDEGAKAELHALPADAQDAIRAGMKLMGKDDRQTAQAADKLDRALKVAPSSGVALWIRGLVANEAGDSARGLALLEQALTANAKLQQAWVALAEARLGHGQPDKALDALAKAEALDPKDPWVHVVRARLHLDAARLDDGRKEVAKALGKSPGSAALKLLDAELARLGSRPDWKTSYKKENATFIVETSVSSKLAADLLQRLVVYRRFLEEKFPIPVKQTAPSRVWVFDSEKEYHLFADSTSGAGTSDQSIGLYNPLIKTLLLTSKVSAESTQHIIFHEAFHQYLDLAVANPPIWLNEGLAEYYGMTTFDVSNRATEGGILHDRLPTLKLALVSVKNLMSMSDDAFMKPANAELHYAESWALVHYFKRGGNAAATKLFDFYCAAVIAGKSQDDAFILSFGRDGEAPLRAIETDFQSYVGSKLLTAK